MADSAGRQMEVEPIIGNALKVARELNVATPNLDLIYVLSMGLNRSLSFHGTQAQVTPTSGLGNDN